MIKVVADKAVPMSMVYQLNATNAWSASTRGMEIKWETIVSYFSVILKNKYIEDSKTQTSLRERPPLNFKQKSSHEDYTLLD